MYRPVVREFLDRPGMDRETVLYEESIHRGRGDYGQPGVARRPWESTQKNRQTIKLLSGWSSPYYQNKRTDSRPNCDPLKALRPRS